MGADRWFRELVTSEVAKNQNKSGIDSWEDSETSGCRAYVGVLYYINIDSLLMIQRGWIFLWGFVVKTQRYERKCGF